MRVLVIRAVALLGAAIALGTGSTIPVHQEPVRPVPDEQHLRGAHRVVFLYAAHEARLNTANMATTRDLPMVAETKDPCSEVKGPARDFCESGDDGSSCGLRDDWEIPSSKQCRMPSMKKPPHITGPSENQPQYIPAPAMQRNHTSYFYTRPLMKATGFVFYGSSICCVVGIIFEGRRWVVFYWNGEGVPHLDRLGWCIVGCLVIATSSGTVNLLLR